MTTASHVTTAPRPTEPICPPWCAGHRDGYQSWEVHDDSGAQQRDHSTEVATQIGTTELAVSVCAVEDQYHRLSPAVVEVYAEVYRADLTPSTAREFARLLIENAERAEAHQ